MLQYISQRKNNTFNYKQVAFAINADTSAAHRNIALILAELAFDGDLIEVSPGKYKAPQRSNIATGTFVRRSNGKNSVLTDEDNESIFVAERNSMHALNGDKVKVVIAAAKKNTEPEAEVIEILEKKEQTFIGTLRVEKQYGILVTDSKFLATDIIIPKNRLKGGKTGDKAIARITSWENDEKNPKGEVLDILGVTGETPPRCMPYWLNSDSPTATRRLSKKPQTKSVPA